jgi:hypothetical protein
VYKEARDEVLCFVRSTHLLVDRISIYIGAENVGHRQLIGATKEFVQFEFIILDRSD